MTRGPIAKYKDASNVVQDVTPSTPLPVSAPEELSTPTRTVVTLTGSSQSLVSAGSNRRIVQVFSEPTNASAMVEPTGVTASADEGVPVLPGGNIKITGVAAQSAMTVIGTAGNKLTVYTG